MQTFKTPLFGSYNQRSFTAASGTAPKDQCSRATILTKVTNPITNSVTAYLEKRSGLVAVSTPSSGQLSFRLYASPSTGVIYSIMNFGGVKHLFSGTTDCGIVTGGGGSTDQQYFTETILSGVTYILLATGTIGWYLASDSVATTAYTADGNNSTTITDLKVSGVPSVAGLYVGQKLTAASNIVAGSRIVSINAGAFSAVLDTATTGGAFNDLAITKEPVAKINDVDFPTDAIGGFSELDGYIFIMTSSGKVFNSDLNSVSSWTATGFISCTQYADNGVGCIRFKDKIAAFSNDSIEFLTNAGNPAGSPLSASPQLSTNAKNLAPASAFALTSMDGVLYWIGADGNIYKMEGYVPQRINSFGAPTGVKAAGFGVGPSCEAFVYNKQTFLSIYDGAAAESIWYSIDNGTFHAPSFNTSGAGGTPSGFPEYAYVSSVAGISYFTTSQGTGKIYALGDNHISSPAVAFQDNGNAYTMSIQIQTDMGTNKRKFYRAVRLLADVVASSLSIYYSDDDGVTWSSARTMSLATIAAMYLTRFGSGKGQRMWKFEHNANTSFRCKMAEFEFDVASQ